MAEKPRRPMSAFMMWLNSTRESIKAQNPGLTVTEIARKGGQMWRALDKTEWEEKAAKAKEQYEKELAIYNANRGVTQEPDEDGDDVREECGKKIKVSKPKLPMSAYMMWLNSARDSIKAQNPGLKMVEIARKGGEMWRAMKDNSEWMEKAAKARKQYEKELAIFNEKSEKECAIYNKQFEKKRAINNANRGVTQEPDEYDISEEGGYRSSCDYTDYDEDEEHGNSFLYNALRCGGTKQTKNTKQKQAAKAKHQREKYIVLKNAKTKGTVKQKPVKDKEKCESCGSSDDSDYEYRPYKYQPSGSAGAKGKKIFSKVSHNRPKRSMPAYMMWLNSARESIKAQNPGLTVTEIATKAGEIWRAMEDKSEWEEKAAKANEQYYRELYSYSVDGSGDEEDHKRACKALKEIEQNKAMPGVEESSFIMTLFEPPKITCSYKTTGCLYPQENGFMYVPETPVNISFEDIVNVKVARGEASSNQQSFDLEILLKSGDVHTFNGINVGEYEKLINSITSKNVNIKSELFLFDDAEIKNNAKEYLNAKAEENKFETGDTKPAMEINLAEVKIEIVPEEDINENV